ncbi:MAG TPA: hypothetical protein VJ508_17395 [Saprospiraceae bacterium]|nr:hypothetical protein [Saprospiraceae bacterium]
MVSSELPNAVFLTSEKEKAKVTFTYQNQCAFHRSKTRIYPVYSIENQ